MDERAPTDPVPSSGRVHDRAEPALLATGTDRVRANRPKTKQTNQPQSLQSASISSLCLRRSAERLSAGR